MQIHSLKSFTILSSLVAVMSFSIPVLAQEDPGHPRVNQVENRIDNQESNVNKSEANGTLTPKQATRDENRDQKVQNQLTKDEAKNGGHITKAEQRKLNRELKHNKKHIHKQKVNDAK